MGKKWADMTAEELHHRREYMRMYMRKCREANREQKREADRKWYQANRERTRERRREADRKWRETHPERNRAKVVQWQSENRNFYLLGRRVRHAKKRLKELSNETQ